MKENFEIIKENFNTTTGETIIVINTNYGTFSGVTKIDEIDAQYPSIYHASEIALAKAQKKWAKAMIIMIREKMKSIHSIIKQFPDCPFPQPNSHEARLVFSAYKETKKELEQWTKRLHNLNQYIISRIKVRDMMVKKYLDKN